MSDTLAGSRQASAFLEGGLPTWAVGLPVDDRVVGVEGEAIDGGLGALGNA
jgi:hypothetical protein